MGKNSLLYRIKSRLALLFPIGHPAGIANFHTFDDAPKRILCATAAGMGDTIMVAPALTAIKEAYPDAQLTVVGHDNRGFGELCRLIPAVDETVDIGLRNYRWSSVIGFMLWGFWRLLFRLRRQKFDLVVIFMPNIIRRFLLVGIGSRHWIYGNRVDDYPGTLALELLGLIGVDRLGNRSIFRVPKPDNADVILPKTQETPLIGVHPFRGVTWREWRKFDPLLDEMMALNGTIILLGKRDGYIGRENVHNLVNRLTLAELFWVIGKLDVLVTSDSGPMHIAFALGTPTVTLFGPVRPELLAPAGIEKKHRILYNRSIASEKVERVTERKVLDNTAMQSITVGQVLAEVKDFLGNRSL